MILISFPLICIAISTAAIFVIQRQREQLQRLITRAFQAGTGIQRTNNLLMNAESAARGYLLTRDPSFLEPYEKAQQELPEALQSLRATLRDSGSQLARVDRVEAVCRQRLASLSAALSEARAARLPARLEQGRLLSEQARREFAAIAAEESRRWVTQVAAETALRERLSTVSYAGAAVCLTAGGLAMLFFLTGIVRRCERLRLNADRLARGEPLAVFEASADELGRLGEALAAAAGLLSEREGELRRLNQQLDLRVQQGEAQLEQETAGRKRAQEQLLHSQKMEAIGRLAGGVAHDFNNILTIIFGFAETLAERLPDDSRGQEDLKEIVRAAEHASSLTRQLLAFSRRQILQPKVVDLNTVLARTEKMLRRLIGEDIELRTQPAPAPVQTKVDEGQIEQVILNLAVNARDAMPNGGKLAIRLEEVELDESYCQRHLPVRPGHFAMLAITDSGQGMPPEVQARIFEPFFTTKERGKGTGLGLSTVYGIVEQSGGAIWVYSEVGIGTTFKIYLPLAGAGDEPAREAPAPETAAREHATVLLVEDEPVVRQIASQILSRCGYTVLEAESADRARALCRSHPVDILLTDVIMPKTNGCQLASELQTQRPAMKVIYMSGYTDDALTQHGIASSGAAFIEKPFTPRALTSKVRETLALLS